MSSIIINRILLNSDLNHLHSLTPNWLKSWSTCRTPSLQWIWKQRWATRSSKVSCKNTLTWAKINKEQVQFQFYFFAWTEMNSIACSYFHLIRLRENLLT